MSADPRSTPRGAAPTPTVVMVDHHRYDSPLRVGSHHLSRELSKRGRRVIWISHPRSWLHRAFGRLPPERVVHDDGVVELIPRVKLPYVRLPGLDHRFWGERWLGRRLPTSIMREVERAGGCELLWISDFTLLALVDLLPARKVVLRFFDHLDQFRWTPRSIHRLVHRYLHDVDLVLASSLDLVEKLAARGIEADYLPNGAHLPDEPRRLLAVPRRNDRAVYVGAIESWFDLDAIDTWATALPEVRFEIAGPNRLGLSSRLPNVHFVGAVPYDRLADFLAGAGCGLIPFRLDDLTRGVHPIKLYDYLVHGCPVLSMALPEVRPHPAGIAVYRDAREGAEQLARLLAADIDRAALQDLAIANGWGRRIETAFELLGEPVETS